MELKVKKLHEDAIMPTYGSEGAACFDLYAMGSDFLCHELPTAVFDTGIAFEIPPDKVLLVYGRSGLAFKENVRLANCVAVIDSDFRDSVKIKLTLDATNPSHLAGYRINVGDRIAQAMLVPVERVSFVEVDELSETARGTGGLGSTGR